MALIADLVIPFLIVAVILAPLLPTVRKSDRWAFWLRSLNAIGAVYLIMLIDLWLRIWPRVSLDYSTHTALAVSLSTSLVVLSRRWLFFVLPLLIGNTWLMIALRYHSPADIVTTAAVLVPLTWLIHRVSAKRSGSD